MAEEGRGAPRILVYGTLMIDVVAPMPLGYRPGGNYIAGIRVCYGGGGGNVAYYLAKLGAVTAVAGALGVDPLGRAYEERLQSLGVKLYLARQGSTGIVVALTHEEGERGFIADPGANRHATSDLVVEALQDFKPQVLVIHGYLLAVPDTRWHAVEAARAAAKRGVKIVFDPGYPNMGPEELEAAIEIARLSTLITPNEEEAKSLSAFNNESSASQSEKLKYKIVALKKGWRGARLYAAGRLVAEARPPPARVVNTVGAGDAFTAAAAHSIAVGEEPARLLQRAVTLGAKATTCPCPQC